MPRSALRPSLLAAAFAVGLIASAVWAAPKCKGFSVTSVNFGVYNPLAPTPLDSVGSVAYQCPPSLPPPRIEISTGGSGSYSARAMTNPADPAPLQYNLFLDAARTAVWGDGTGGTSAPTGPQGKASISVYGRVPALQDVAAGTFTDTVVVTFYF